MRLRALLVGACLLWPSLSAAQEGKPALPRVVTTGASTITVPAARARLTIGVTAKAPKAKDAAARIASLMSSVRDALVGVGFDRGSLVSAGYSVATQDDPDERTVKAYLASSSLSAELSDLAQLGAVVDVALAAGATDVSQIEFLPKDAAAARDRALDAAFQAARRDAEVLARAAGARLGRIIAISTERDYGGPTEMVMMRAAPGMGTSIPAPEVSVTASVRVEWQLDFAKNGEAPPPKP
jgi:uncharacterized protein YggE